MNNLNYVTYQSFPADTANSLQTMANIKYLIRQGHNVSLYFPLREKKNTADPKILKEFYSITEDIKIIGVKHNLPFGKINILNRVLYLYSHLVWSYSIVKKLNKEKLNSDFFITRSDWVFLFLSLKNRKVIFECHQYTKIRKFLINRALKRKYSKIIFLNDILKEDYEKKYTLKDNYTVLHNGVDLEYYSQESKKKSGEIVFVGRLKRFNESRNINFLLEGLASLGSEHTLKIVGATESEILDLKEESTKLGIETQVKIIKRVNYSAVAKELSSASIGILTNSSTNTHSTSYTSPLKYFEYLASGLNIVAVDFPSHRNLPYSDNITFFEENNIESFVNAVKNAGNSDNLNTEIFPFISLQTRAKKITDFLSS